MLDSTLEIIKCKRIQDTIGMVYDFIERYTYYYDKDDLVQAGIMGILKANDNFDESMGVKFSTYAFNYIRGEVLKYINADRSIKVSSEHMKLSKCYYNTCEKLTHSYNRTPTHSEICVFMEIDEAYMSNVLASCEYVLSSSNTLDSEEEVTYEDMASVDYRNDIDNEILIKDELAKLPLLERKVIEMRYYEDMTQQEVAKKLKLSQVKVSRTETKCIKGLSKRIAA